MILSIILGMQLTQPKFQLISESIQMILVEGSVKVISRNHMPSVVALSNEQNSEHSSSPSKVIAVRGKVRALPGKASISIDSILSKKFETTIDKTGRFRFHLESGMYTFFILNGNCAYLNQFSGNGYFKPTLIYKNIYDLLIIDDRKASF